MYPKEQAIEWLRKVFKSNIEETDVELTGSTEKGDGYMGDIVFVTLKDKKSTLNLVIKSGKQQELTRQVIPIRKAFLNESIVYTKLFPEFLKLQNEKSISKRFDNYPKCYGEYYTENTEVLVLENLKCKGYELHPRKQTMSKNVIIEVLKVYGRFHALSFVLKEKNAEKFKEFAESLAAIYAYIIRQEQYDEYFRSEVAECKKILAKKEVGQDILNKIDTLITAKDQLGKKWSYDEPNAVILHGDCWNNNFMFKFKNCDYSQCEEVKILDWQISCIGSPARDLSYFIFTCCSGKELDDLENLLKTYHESLSTTLKEFDCDPEKIFPFSQLQHEWKTYGFFGVCVASNLIRITTLEKEDVPDYENFEKMEDMELAFKDMFKDSKSDIFSERIYDVMTHPEYLKFL